MGVKQMMNALLLSRIQFGITITFHIIFPALSIGLATFILIVEGMWLNSRDPILYQSCRFWTKILALTFGMGIISGLAMEFQLGTNWGGFSQYVGPVLGVLFTLEALTAFFVEATFLGFMLFGWGRVHRYFHFFSTVMVWLAVMISAFWIMAANSWMQTPDGVRFVSGKFIVESWYRVIFNPSTVVRYTHMILASYIAAAMVVVGVASYYLLKNKFIDFAKFNLKFMIVALCIMMPLQVFIGDEVGLVVYQYQPIKTAAIEGLWDDSRGAPLLIFAYIDQKAQRNRFEMSIPHLASVINTHQWNGQMQGLKSIPLDKQPAVGNVFYAFRIMVGLGILMLLFSYYGLILLCREKSFNRYFLRAGLVLIPSGLLAMMMGWYTAEMGRQP